MVGLSLIPCLGSAMKNQEDESARRRTSWSCFPPGRKIVRALSVSGEQLLAKDIAHYPANFSNMPDNFLSRQEAYKTLWNALVNRNGHPMLGIYGMPGVGKSGMMELAYKEAMDKKIFDRATRATVGAEKIDVLKLQVDLARGLNLPLESDDVKPRATELNTSLRNGGKTLIMLDDVWEVIPLETIGIPSGDHISKGCKILFTSRRHDVCLLNNCKDPIEIKTLTTDETWEMFKNTVGTSKMKVLEENSFAKEVYEASRGLPLIISDVGKQLKLLNEDSWIDALNQYKSGKLGQIDRIYQCVYPSFEKSFKKLKDGPATCLLLCSLFEVDADIDINMLLDLAEEYKLSGSGNNIHLCVDILKSSSLLLEGKEHYTVKMNGIIRHVARLLAARDPRYAFLYIRCNANSSEMADYSTRRLLQLDLEEDNVGFPVDLMADYSTRRLLQLDLEEDNVGFPVDLECPDLHTLWLQCKYHSQQDLSGFLNGFMNLRSLVIKGMTSSQTQLSVRSLNKLRVLILDGCDVNQSFLSSITESLETLSIRECHLPSPFYVPELRNLIKLEYFRPPEKKGISGFEQPIATKILHKLRVLILDGCDVSQTFLRSIPKKLERLTIRDCNLPSPLHLPRLRHLRKLEMLSKTQIEMTAETERRIRSLKELNIPGGIKTCHDGRGGKKNIKLKRTENARWESKHSMMLQSITMNRNGTRGGRSYYVSKCNS